MEIGYPQGLFLWEVLPQSLSLFPPGARGPLTKEVLLTTRRPTRSHCTTLRMSRDVELSI